MIWCGAVFAHTCLLVLASTVTHTSVWRLPQKAVQIGSAPSSNQARVRAHADPLTPHSACLLEKGVQSPARARLAALGVCSSPAVTFTEVGRGTRRGTLPAVWTGHAVRVPVTVPPFWFAVV